MYPGGKPGGAVEKGGYGKGWQPMGHGLVDGGGRGANVSCSEPPPLEPSFRFSVAISVKG